MRRTSEDQVADHNVDWEPCTQVDCIGIPLQTGERCWAHAAATDLDAALKRLGEDGRLDARGVPITADLLERLLAAVPHDEHAHAVLPDAQFDKATFQGDARFGEATFQGDARFSGATFQGDARFYGATFQGDAGFYGATFRGAAGFSGATFRDTAGFSGATFRGAAGFDRTTFRGTAGFDRATFQDTAGFHGATFRGAAAFSGATFQGHAAFRGATFRCDAGFKRVTFQGRVRFYGATFRGNARFDVATFQQARQLGPMLVRKSLLLDQAVFHERAQIDVAAAAVCCQRTRFLAGVQLRVRWAQVVLDDADLAAPSILSGVRAFSELQEDRLLRRWERLGATDTGSSRPRLVSLRRADVAGLTVAGVDMRACRFAGAHHLDQLRAEESDFASTPTGWRWTTRQTIAEEHHWRARSHSDGTSTPNGQDAVTGAAPSGEPGPSAGWYSSAQQPPAWLEAERPNPEQIAALYRDLRKGREDNKDEPGAADFYYGEMEMRRHARRLGARQARKDSEFGRRIASATEYAILTVYWLVSGYGLRAWRALASLVVVIMLAGLGFAFWGFAAPEGPSIRPVRVDARGAPIYAQQPVTRPTGLEKLPEAIWFSTESATSLLRGPDQPLTLPGRALHMAVRLLGPILLGLAVLSIRGRVKR
jgi:uncharacterized protein YjbI with pentapeptide repeats